MGPGRRKALRRPDAVRRGPPGVRYGYRWEIGPRFNLGVEDTPRGGFGEVAKLDGGISWWVRVSPRVEEATMESDTERAEVGDPRPFTRTRQPDGHIW